MIYYCLVTISFTFVDKVKIGHGNNLEQIPATKHYLADVTVTIEMITGSQ